MVGTVFLDSNIWLYALLEGQEPAKSEIAWGLVQQQAFLLTSVQVVNEVCLNLLRKAEWEEDELWNVTQSIRRRCTVLPVEIDTALDASRLRQRYRFAFWDSLIVASALQGGASLLYSEDMDGGLTVDGSLRIVNPFE